MAVLVTGGTGFLGRAVVERLVRGLEVVALHRPGTRPPSVPGVTWLARDLREPLRGLPQRLEAVVHLAHSSRLHDFPEGVDDVVAVNVAATVALADLCRRAAGTRFVLASSGAVYAPGQRALHEDDVPAPPSFYGDSKLAGERAVLRFRELFDVAVLRPFFLYGPEQHTGFMAGIVQRVRSGAPVRLAGDEGLRCNPCFLADAATAVEAALDGAPWEVVNVAGPETVSLRDLAGRIGAIVGRAPAFTHASAAGDLVADARRMRTLVDGPLVGVDEGLRLSLGAGPA